jgi:hypothetical protein
LNGSTVITPNINVTVTGQGTGAAGTSWQVQGTVNGSLFVNLSGLFEENNGAVDFGGGTLDFPVHLKKGSNTLILRGSADGCTVSDQIVVYYVAKNIGGNNSDCAICAFLAGDPINIATGNKVD